jgi:hypothetical protein
MKINKEVLMKKHETDAVPAARQINSIFNILSIKINWVLIERLIDIYADRADRLTRENRLIQAAYWLGKRHAIEFVLLDMGR